MKLDLFITALCIVALATLVQADSPESTTLFANSVRQIDWSRFREPVSESAAAELNARMIANCTRAAHVWADSAFPTSESGDRYILINRNEEPAIRPVTSAAVGFAVSLRTGVASTRVEIPTTALIDQAAKLIKGAAIYHKANGGEWGDHWQSSLWTAQLGRAAWMLWDDIDHETREMVCQAVVYEANRHLGSGYEVPYWNGEGGDSKAEENSWESMVLQQAVAMLPDHPNAVAWKKICSELQISAYSKKEDRDRDSPVLDGKSPREWLRGYNVRDDGIVINHDLIHNDYMTSIAHLQMQGYLVFSLAGTPVPETVDFNFGVTYQTLVTKEFESPPFDLPGGTMFIPGKAEQYYPGGTDWSRLRFACFLGMDAIADILGYDRDLPHTAAHWHEVRAERILEMQARHDDTRMYAENEFTSYPPREQMVFWMLSDAHLLQWLADRGQLSEKANWLN